MKFNPSKLTNLRLKRGLTQSQLAALTKEVDPVGKGISESGIFRIEKGLFSVSAHNLGLLADALKTSNINQFFDKKEEIMKYKAKIYGNSWARGPVVNISSIDEARNWAIEFGSTADKCVVYDSAGDEVALFVRDTSTDEWFDAEL